MNVRELNENQLIELKQYHLVNVVNEDKGTFWSELGDVNETITDEEIYEHYDNTCFTEEDFSAEV